MKPLIHVSDLIIECTRRCNMTCSHCMRGEAEPVDIHPRVLEAITKQVDYIGIVTFTGGEPSLNPRAIDLFIQCCKKYNTEVDSFYITTNGKKYSDAFLLSLIKLYSFCSSNEASMVVVSNTPFHAPEQNREEIKKLESFKFVPTKRLRLQYSHVKNMGRAKKYGIGEIDYTPQTEYYIEKFDDIYQIDMLYVNCYGYMFPDCDMSYAYQRQEKTYNILSDGVGKIIEDWEWVNQYEQFNEVSISR